MKITDSVITCRRGINELRFYAASPAIVLEKLLFCEALGIKREENSYMQYEWIDEYLLSKKGVVKDLQKDWNWVRYKIYDKMFAAICRDRGNNPYYITLKLEPMKGEVLRSQYEDIIPGYYMNKVHWNSIAAGGSVPDDLLKDMLDESYQIVLGSFSRKKQKQLLEE